jgi:UDP-N-acetylmuramate dehydrogenase
LKEQYPDIVSFVNSETEVKLAAAWLIDSCGWKGKREGDAGVHEHHALVLVNYGNSSGTAILNLSLEIAESVKSKFGIELEREVNLVE